MPPCQNKTPPISQKVCTKMVEKCSVNTSPIMALVVVGKKLGHFEYFCQKNKIKKQTQNIISIMAHILSAIKKM